VADFNHDGKLELAILNYTPSGSVSILLGNGDGSFQPPVSYPTGEFPGGRLVADLNRDGDPDLLVNEGGFFLVFLGNGDGTFQASLKYSMNSIESIVAGDFNGDGIPDLALTLFNNGELAILLGNGDGTFKPGATYMIEPGELLTADLNGDGNLGLVIHFLPTSQTLTLLGNGDGTFRAPLLPFHDRADSY